MSRLPIHLPIFRGIRQLPLLIFSFQAVVRRRRDAILVTVERELPLGVQVMPPCGGLYLWLRLPEGWNADKLLPLACQAGVSYVPGSAFFTGDGSENHLRLNFATREPREIDEGIRRLGSIL